MNESLQAILDSLPPKPRRSKLGPYEEFIRELRRRGRSYQEIAEILHDRCGVNAAVHTLYNFVRVREKTERPQRAGRSAEAAKSRRPEQQPQLQPRPRAGDDAWKNIEALKQRQREPASEEKVFVYNDDEPLRLVRGTRNTSGGKSKNKTER